MNKWSYVQKDAEYYDFNKRLLLLPDDGCTSLELILTFNVEKHTATMRLTWNNDDGYPEELTHRRVVQWDAALASLSADGVEVPQELKPRFLGTFRSNDGDFQFFETHEGKTIVRKDGRELK